MDDELGGTYTSPNIEYPFIPELVKKNYEQLKMNFKNGKEEITETPEWRDDIKFLFHLTRVFLFFEETGRFLEVKFQKIPKLGNGRWNSRAILVLQALLALLAFILLPKRTDSLLEIYRFISYRWADHWFTDQIYNADDYHKLCSSMQVHGKTLNRMKKFNHCAERTIKCL